MVHESSTYTAPQPSAWAPWAPAHVMIHSGVWKWGSEWVGMPGALTADGMVSWNQANLNAIKTNLGTSLVVQWVRRHAPNAGGTGLIPS